MSQIDLSKLPADFPQLFAYGYFTGVNEKTKSWDIGLEGMSLMVPVDQETFKNPPQYGERVIIRGVLNTTNFGGRPVGTQMTVTICPPDQWPADNEPKVRFEGLFDLDKESWGPDENKSYALKYSAVKFQYQTKMEPEFLDRFPTGKHILIGRLIADQTYNRQSGVRVTLWKCVPIGVPSPKRQKA